MSTALNFGTELLIKARKSFATGKTKNIAFRKQQLLQLNQFFIDCESEILQALSEDLRKSRHEALLYEIEMTKREILHMVRNLDSYAEPQHLPKNLLAILDHGYVQSEPYGVVLILGAWNYPYLLLCKPFIGALAAGNFCILKPSEISSASSVLLAKKLPKYLDPDCCLIVEANAEETKQLLINKFDFIFCTGSTNVGRSVYSAAAVHLTPCVLELGGKSPCYIDESADFQLAAKRLLWAKCINLGQTCIAPDYILCSKAAETEFVQVANKVFKEWYGTDLQNNPDLSRIINVQHFTRLETILKTTKGQIIFGGNYNKDDLWIEPTIITNVDLNDSTMQDEIFGPILPILTVNSEQEAIEIILNTKAKPLSFYIFSKNDKIIKKMLNEISSGSVCINDCVWQNGWDGLPFGGVGNSGMGRYHGKYSFQTFSHEKSVLHRGFGYLSEKLGEARYPPYTKNKLQMFKAIVNNFHRFNVNITMKDVLTLVVLTAAIVTGIYLC